MSRLVAGSAPVTSKGRITIPVAVRHMLGARPGDRIAFVRNAAGRWEISLNSSATSGAQDGPRGLGHDGPSGMRG
jgi:AbrB family looped-hinge helix DNA binding protein